MTTSAGPKAAGAKGDLRAIASKVPQVTVFFWIIKVLCTTVGETASDFLNIKMGFGLYGTSVAAGIALAIVLFLQFRAKKYVPGIYWLTVVLVSVFGTLITDILTDSVRFPLEGSTIIFSVALAATFAVWYAKEGTLSIHSIFTVRRETFYWLAILFTFALGTATGDLVAEKLGVGYLNTGLLVLGIIALSGIGWRLGLDAVLAFWVAYILTRPLGASVGDYLSQPRSDGGLGLGPTITSAVFLSAILATVVYLAVSRRDLIPKEKAAKEDEAEQKRRIHPMVQTAIVVALFVAAGGSGYYLRSAQLARVAAASATPDRPLGDLSVFRGLVKGMQASIRSGDLAGARAKADDLETAWDNGQARMKPMNPDKWTVMDDACDGVLTSIRSSKASDAERLSALDALMTVIDSLDLTLAPAESASSAPEAGASSTPPASASSAAGASGCPAVVQQSIDKSYPTATITACKAEHEDGQDQFEVKLDDHGQKVEVDVTPDGRILQTEVAIPLDQVPTAVTVALAKKFPDAKPTKAEKQVRTGKGTFYELKFPATPKAREVTFGDDGTFVEEE
ncbi:MAG: COG4705 family protein [Polyangiaceae bacterium]